MWVCLFTNCLYFHAGSVLYSSSSKKNTHRKAKQSFESHFAIFPQIALSSRWRETISLRVSGGMTPGKISGERQLEIELIHITQVIQQTWIKVKCVGMTYTFSIKSRRYKKFSLIKTRIDLEMWLISQKKRYVILEMLRILLSYSCASVCWCAKNYNAIFNLMMQFLNGGCVEPWDSD